MSDWNTRLNPLLSRAYGVEECHEVCFEPPTWGSDRPQVSLLIPECQVQLCRLIGGVPHVVVNHASPNDPKPIKWWIRGVCEIAVESHAWLSFACDTKDDAEL